MNWRLILKYISFLALSVLGFTIAMVICYYALQLINIKTESLHSILVKSALGGFLFGLIYIGYHIIHGKKERSIEQINKST